MAFIKFTTSREGRGGWESTAAASLALTGSASAGPSPFQNLRHALAGREAPWRTRAYCLSPPGHDFLRRDNDSQSNDYPLGRVKNGSEPANQAPVSHMVVMTETSFWSHGRTKIKINELPPFQCWWHPGVFILFMRHRYDVGVTIPDWADSFTEQIHWWTFQIS